MKALILFTVIGCALWGVFIEYPYLDLKFSGLFYDESKGFLWSNHPFTILIYHLVRVTTASIVGIIMLLGFVRWSQDRGKSIPSVLKKVWLPTYRQAIFVVLVFAIGPGMVVHWGIKEYWERSRPINIEQFGGPKQFTMINEIGSEGGKSFISGHASAGFATVALAFLYRGRKRLMVYGAGLGFGAIAALMRVIQGKHFLSDVTFAAILTLFIIHLLYMIILKKGPQETS